MMQIKHIPVMLKEALDILAIKSQQWYVDATFGQGGHTQKILSLGGKVIAFDYDQKNIKTGQEKFKNNIKNKELILLRENFDQLKNVISQIKKDYSIEKISGVLFDFGTTTQQLSADNRGLSFHGQDQELDMRLDSRLGVKAKDLLAIMGQKQLQKIFEVFGGETEARKISKKILELRKENHYISSANELAEFIYKTKSHHPKNIHPATKVFQALRIAVNNELENIQQALPQALELIGSQDKIVTIAFHEGEDRIVKHQFKAWEKEQKGVQDPKKALKPSEQEVLTNPNSRSAKLRGFIKK